MVGIGLAAYLGVEDTVITQPSTDKIKDLNAVHFIAQTLTAEQKLQARTNIGAAEDPNTSGDSPATLEKPIL